MIQQRISTESEKPKPKRRARRKPKKLEVKAVVYKARRGPKGYKFPVELAENFGTVGLNQSEIAGILGVTLRTVQREFEKADKSEFVVAYQKGAANMRNGLRKTLLQRATKGGSDAALIFALKNYCGMRDKQEVDHSGEIKVNVTMGGKAFKKPPKWLKCN